MRNNIVGLTFGRLVALECVGSNSRGSLLWLCVCSCGNKKIVIGANLTSGKTKSCGCLSVETARMSNTTHGHSGKGNVSGECRS